MLLLYELPINRGNRSHPHTSASYYLNMYTKKQLLANREYDEHCKMTTTRDDRYRNKIIIYWHIFPYAYRTPLHVQG